MNNNVQKPVSIIIDDLKSNIIEIINNSNLHISIVELIVKDLFFEIKEQSKLILEMEKTKYDKIQQTNEST